MGDVYSYLEGTGLTVVGGRQGAVGIPGFVLGGGVSFFSYEYGFTSTNGNTRGFEVRYLTIISLTRKAGFQSASLPMEQLSKLPLRTSIPTCSGPCKVAATPSAW